MNSPKISICIITYNQDNFIRNCLESVVSQKIDFPYEIVIGEDNSTDNTLNICREFRQRFPNKIKLIERSENLGMSKNWASTLRECKGEYIAICEGDDYWTDTSKLQKQVDFMDANPEYGMVCTDYDKYFQKTTKFKRNCFPKKYTNSGEVKFEDYILDKSTIATASVVIKSCLLNQYFSEVGLENFSQWLVSDVPLYLFIALKSKIGVLPDVTTVYRINEKSASKFTEVHKYYEYLIKGFEIPVYFRDKYEFEEEVKENITVGFYRVYLRYRFEAKLKDVGKKEFLQLREMNRLTLDDYIRYYCYNFPSFIKSILLYSSKIIGKINKIRKK